MALKDRKLWNYECIPYCGECRSYIIYRTKSPDPPSILNVADSSELGAEGWALVGLRLEVKVQGSGTRVHAVGRRV